jgi:hypothetical protein
VSRYGECADRGDDVDSEMWSGDVRSKISVIIVMNVQKEVVVQFSFLVSFLYCRTMGY